MKTTQEDRARMRFQSKHEDGLYNSDCDDLLDDLDEVLSSLDAAQARIAELERKRDDYKLMYDNREQTREKLVHEFAESVARAEKAERALDTNQKLRVELSERMQAAERERDEARGNVETFRNSMYAVEESCCKHMAHASRAEAKAAELEKALRQIAEYATNRAYRTGDVLTLGNIADAALAAAGAERCDVCGEEFDPVFGRCRNANHRNAASRAEEGEKSNG